MQNLLKVHDPYIFKNTLVGFMVFTEGQFITNKHNIKVSSQLTQQGLTICTSNSH